MHMPSAEMTYDLIWFFPCGAGAALMLGVWYSLHKGALKLAEGTGTVSAEVADLFKIKVSNPIVGIFVLGLLLVLAPAGALVYLERSQPTYELTIVGELGDFRPNELDVTVKSTMQSIETAHPRGGKFEVPMSPIVDKMEVQVGVPGADVGRTFTSHEIKSKRKLDLGKVDLKPKIKVLPGPIQKM